MSEYSRILQEFHEKMVCVLTQNELSLNVKIYRYNECSEDEAEKTGYNLKKRDNSEKINILE